MRRRPVSHAAAFCAASSPHARGRLWLGGAVRYRESGETVAHGRPIVARACAAERCMFESNFPVDKGSCSYVNGWNAFKRLTMHAGPSERDAPFRGTVTRAYRLG
ncbi:amidohydrolase family protein [Burkholderia diffusa]|uniref:amidohydrolase family protein n=1 Tax=Burkholderia diffusa TaxID=488732 RepID=UPI0034559067